MAIRLRQKDIGGYRVEMTACPLCGEPFEPGDSRAWHFYREHGPEDIGL